MFCKLFPLPHLCPPLEAPLAAQVLAGDVGLPVDPLDVRGQPGLGPAEAAGGAGEEGVGGVGGPRVPDQLLHYLPRPQTRCEYYCKIQEEKKCFEEKIEYLFQQNL